MVGMVWALKLYAVVGETADTERTSLNDVAHNLRPQIFACRRGVLFGGSRLKMAPISSRPKVRASF